MLRYILNNLAGYLRIRVEGYSPERFLNEYPRPGFPQTATNGQEEQGKGTDHPEKRSPVFYT